MERDDIIEYSLDVHHSAEEGAKIRKKIFFVTFLLSAITILEVAVGVMFGRGTVSDLTWTMIKWFYIILTLVKAGYIVLVFMHLGEERKSTKYVILAPYALFITYLIFICINESNYINSILSQIGVQ